LLRYRNIVWPVLLLALMAWGQPAFAQFETRGASVVSPYPGPVSVATGDFNRDGKLDAAVASSYENGGVNSDQIQVLLGKGDGTFEPPVNYTVGTAPSSIAAADFNHDGNLDLVVSNSIGDTVSVLLGNGDGTFQPALTLATPQDPIYVAVADFNRDGNLDIATLNLADYTGACLCVAIMLGNGDGTFQQPPIITTLPVGPFGLGIGYFNRDNKLDLAVAEEFGGASEIQILLGNGDGTFRFGQSYPVGAGPTAIAVADFNGDHIADLAVAESGGMGVGVFLGNGDGTFQPDVDYRANSPRWIAAADLNGDGKVDLVGANIAFPSAVAVLMGNGDGTFHPVVDYADGAEDEFVAVGDFNGDRKPDIVVLDFLYSKAIVLLNTGVVSFAPNTPLNFKTQKSGTTSAPKTVTLTNTGTTELTITSMKATGQFGVSSNCGSGVAAGASCTISVTFSPTSRGVKSGTITIQDSASSKPQVIELSGTGT
jgi:hypothetical protein